MRRNKSDYYLIDGFPRNQNNLTGWLNETKNNVNILSTIVLNCDKEKIIERIKQRKRSDDSIEILMNRFRVFENDTMPIIQELNK